MSKNRVKLIRMAFQKIDKDGNGKLTVEDLKGCASSPAGRHDPLLPDVSRLRLTPPFPPTSVYDVRNHPKFKTGEMDEDEILLGFLASFDTPGQADGTVGGGGSTRRLRCAPAFRPNDRPHLQPHISSVGRVGGVSQLLQRRQRQHRLGHVL